MHAKLGAGTGARLHHFIAQALLTARKVVARGMMVEPGLRLPFTELEGRLRRLAGAASGRALIDVGTWARVGIRWRLAETARSAFRRRRGRRRSGPGGLGA